MIARTRLVHYRSHHISECVYYNYYMCISIALLLKQYVQKNIILFALIKLYYYNRTIEITFVLLICLLRALRQKKKLESFGCSKTAPQIQFTNSYLLLDFMRALSQLKLSAILPAAVCLSLSFMSILHASHQGWNGYLTRYRTSGIKASDRHRIDPGISSHKNGYRKKK